MVLYEEQDEALWDAPLIDRGRQFLELSAAGEEITTYHLEAWIAYCHCLKEDTKEKWEHILQLYDQLLRVNYSPGVALNRSYALYKARGREVALTETENLKLENNHFYFVLLGELYKNYDNDKAKLLLQRAHSLAKTQTERQIILKKINDLH
jgi:RNA polymerase sigma-70 factor (ECF subfamily)